jgi:hypothetical protein
MSAAVSQSVSTMVSITKPRGYALATDRVLKQFLAGLGGDVSFIDCRRPGTEVFAEVTFSVVYERLSSW